LVLPFWYLLTRVDPDILQTSSKTVVCVCAMLFCFFQLAEQAKFLNKTVVHIAVGTPKRITQLLENGKQLYF